MICGVLGQTFQEPRRSVHDCAEVLDFSLPHLGHTLNMPTEQMVQYVERWRNEWPCPI